MASIQIDRATFIAALGGSEAVATMSDEQRAEALDRFLVAQLNSPDYLQRIADHRAEGTGAVTLRRGAGAIFGDGRHALAELVPMPKRPTLLDFLRLRSSFPMVRHLLQSAEHARRSGAGEQEILACLLHDLGQLLTRVDHGWWIAQMVEPYVSEEVAFAIRYH